MQDLTKGSIARNLLKMTSFMLVSMIFQTLYFLVDLYFVGRLGKAAVAAVSLSGNLTFVVLAATQMLAVGTTSLIAQATGRKDRAEARLIFNQSQVLSLLVGGLFLAVMLPLRGLYARGLSADPQMARLTGSYLSWYVPAMAMQFAMVATSAALRGTGNFKPGMVVQTSSVILNMLLAPILIFGWGTGHPLGVAGAALASFISVVVAVVALNGYVLGRQGYLKFTARDCRPRLRLWIRMLKIGLPAGAEFAMMALYMLVVYSITRPFGAEAQAGFGIGLRVVQSGFLPVVALGFAVSPVAGQNFGARQPERVRQTFRVAVLMSSAMMVVFTAVSQLAGESMIGVFSRDPRVLAVGGEYLRIISFNFVASGIVFVSSSMFQALGNTIPALITSTVRMVLLTVPAYLMSKAPGFQLHWIWYLSMGVVLVQMSLNLLFLRSELRRRLSCAAAAVPAVPAVATG
jgi:putative MATE family efflux protein